MKKKTISLFLFILLIAGCRQAPHSESAITDKRIIENYELNNNKTMVESASSVDEIKVPTSYKIYYASEFGNVLDMEVASIQSDEIESRLQKDLFTYSVVNRNVDDSDIDLFYKSLFGTESSSENYIYYPENDSSESFLVDGIGYLLTARGQSRNLCPYDSNIFNDYSNCEIGLNLSEATELCEGTAKRIGLSDYKVDYWTPYGKTIGEPFFRANLCVYIDGIPVASNLMNTCCEMDIISDGIYSIRLACFDLRRGDKIGEIISLEEAVEKLKNQLDYITIIPRETNPDTRLNEFGAICDFHVSEISFEYVVGKKMDQVVARPAWRFLLSDLLGNSRSILLAIDAETGEVIF